MNGIITVAGMGPGPKELMAPAVIEAIKAADTIAGYTSYIKLLNELINGKNIISTGMRSEVERVEASLEAAAAGSSVCLVSSGDAGVYGMAGLALEMLYDRGLDKDVEIRIIPGITAASSCAALLGAPLMHDFCVISLSDLLTPKELIEKRLRLAAEGDFVTVLYNPKSRRRVELIETACKTFLLHRSGETPVGIVNNAYREACTVKISCLNKLADHYDDIDMSSTLIIGSSSTQKIGNRMITPRGYKY